MWCDHLFKFDFFSITVDNVLLSSCLEINKQAKKVKNWYDYLNYPLMPYPWDFPISWPYGIYGGFPVFPVILQGSGMY